MGCCDRGWLPRGQRLEVVVSVRTLIDAGVAPTQARLFAQPLDAACIRFGITGRLQLAAFLAQALHESARLTALEESLWYRDPVRIAGIFRSAFRSREEAAPFARAPERLANRVYANRLGNGDEASGDGYRYLGRGVFQLTGRANYRRAAAALGRPYVEQPELVAQPIDAALTAAWYWHSRSLSTLADQGDIDAITRAVNGPAMLGRRERAELYAQALDALEVA
jgi:putative chitinase